MSISRKVGPHIIGGFKPALGRPRLLVLHQCSVTYYNEVRARVGDGCTIVVRWDFNPNWSNPEASARAWFEAHLLEMLACAGPCSVFQPINEPAKENAAAVNRFFLALLPLMHVHGLWTAVGGWGVGHPDLDEWSAYAGMLAALGPRDLVLLHEYWADRADLLDPGHWHAGRFSRPEAWRRLSGCRIGVGECGLDYIEDIKRGKPGWQLSCSAEEFLEDLRLYGDFVDRFPNVVGVAAFTGGDDKRWAKFAIEPLWPALVGQYTPETPDHDEGEAHPKMELYRPIRGWHISQRWGENPAMYLPAFPGHPGLDFGCAEETVVLAPATGTLYVGAASSVYAPAYGVFAWIKTLDERGRTAWLILGHLRRVLAVHQQRVIAQPDYQSIVGLSGNTGRSTAPHVHLGYETLDPNPGYQDNHDKAFYWHDPLRYLVGAQT